jgi:hypothetical protein
MSDEVDDLLRRTMTALDRQVPDGYFDTLPSRTLARLNDPVFDEPLAEDQLRAPSELGVAAVAPSESAEVPAVPALAELAGLDDLARERAARDARAAGANRTGDPVRATPATDQVTPLPGPRGGGRRRPILAVAGLGLAAAAGAMVFVSTGERATNAPEVAAASRERAEQAVPMAAPDRGAAANSSSAGAEAHAGSAAEGGPGGPGDRAVQVAKIAADGLSPTGKPLPATKGGGKGKAGFYEPKKRIGKAGAGDLGESSSKPSGNDVGKLRSEEPARSSLSAGDFQRGMAAVAARARACFAGAQGGPTVQLTVLPSGQVEAVTVIGPLAGTPVGACLERAVKAATFLPWVGEPQRFHYDY